MKVIINGFVQMTTIVQNVSGEEVRETKELNLTDFEVTVGELVVNPEEVRNRMFNQDKTVN